MSEALAAALEYGIAMVVLIILAFYIRWSVLQMSKKDALHAEERKEWRLEAQGNVVALIQMQERSITVVEKNSAAVDGLTRLVESRGR